MLTQSMEMIKIIADLDINFLGPFYNKIVKTMAHIFLIILSHLLPNLS